LVEIRADPARDQLLRFPALDRVRNHRLDLRPPFLEDVQGAATLLEDPARLLP
jgi:hypothetical protein